MSDEIEVSGSADFAAIDQAFEHTASAAQQALASLTAGFEETTGKSEGMVSALKSQLSSIQGLLSTASSSYKAYFQQIADGLQQQISQMEGASAATGEYMAMQSNLSAVTTMSGASFGAYAKLLAGIQPTTLSARDSAEVFRRSLEPLGTQVETISAQGFNRMVAELAGVKSSFLPAAESAQVFQNELGALGSGVTTLTGQQFGALVNNLHGLDQGFMDSRDRAAMLSEAFNAEVVPAAGNVGRGMSETAGLTSGATREFMVLGHEAMTGNFSRIPGSLMVLAQRIGNVSAAAMGMVAAFGAAALAGGELIDYIDRLQNMRVSSEATGALFNPQIPPEAMDKYVNQLHAMSDVTTEQATKAAQSFASMAGATQPVIQVMVDNIQTYAKAMGTNIDQAAAKMAEAWSNPATKGAAFLESMGLNNQAVQQFDSLVTQSNGVVQQRQVMLQALVEATNRVRDVTKGATEDQHTFRNALELASTAGDTTGGSYQLMQQLQQQRAMQETAQKAQTLRDALASVNSQIKETSGGNQWFEQMSTALDKEKAAVASSATNYKAAREGELQTTVNFWQNVLQQGNLTNQQELQAKRALFSAEEQLDNSKLQQMQAAAKQGLQQQLAALNAQQAGYRNDYTMWMSIEQQKLSLIENQLGKKAVLYQQELTKEENFEREHASQVATIQLQALATKETQDRDALEARKSSLDAEVKLHALSKAAEYAELINFATQSYNVELQMLNDDMANMDKSTKAYADMVQKKLELEANFNKVVAQYQSQQTVAQGSYWNTFVKEGDKAFSEVASTASSSFASMIVHGGTWLQFEQAVMEKVISGALNVFGKMVAQWAESQLTMTAANAAGAAARTATSTAAAVTTAGVEGATQKQTVLGHAYSAAAAVYDDVAQIPYVGWILAPPAAAAAFIAVSAFGGGIPSFDVGAWNLPSDTLAMVHKGEMIIPASIANDMRAGLGGAGGLGSLSMSYSPSINVPGGNGGQLTADTLNRILRRSQSNMRQYAYDVGRNGGLHPPGRGWRG